MMNKSSNSYDKNRIKKIVIKEDSIENMAVSFSFKSYKAIKNEYNSMDFFYSM
jgi:hypothetical protein